MQKQYFSQFVTGVLLTSFIAIPALCARWLLQRKIITLEHMYVSHKVQQENSQKPDSDRIVNARRGVDSHWKAMLSASSRTRVVRSATPNPGTIKVRIRRKPGTAALMLRTRTGQ
ncbi:YgiW/YdeI family stress tolerance OB fold protein [Klebsiella pneumoniae]